MDIKISIIIPVYNTEKYLRQCVDSCINQTLKEIEIILVDDCSTDSSWEIEKEYAKKDSRIRIFKQDKNMRQGAARNRGIQEASGEYIWFIDSDDYINLEACQLLYETAKKHDVQILTFSLIPFYENTNQYIEGGYYFGWKKNQNMNPSKNPKLLSLDFTVQPCSYITKRDFIKNYKFRENVIFEDTDFSAILFNECESLRNIAYTAYHRRYQDSSTTQTPMTLKKYQDRLAVVIALDEYVTKNKIRKNTFIYNFTSQYGNFSINEIEQSKFLEEFKSDEGFNRILKKYTNLNDNLFQKLLRFLNRIIKFLLPYGIVKLLKNKGYL